MEFTLEPNPDAGDDKNAPRQKLALAFSTVDVVILGWSLGLLQGFRRLDQNCAPCQEVKEQELVDTIPVFTQGKRQSMSASGSKSL